ncbi:hypothetical protein SARC_17016, partial [Sphaeroforma arctica JP610]
MGRCAAKYCSDLITIDNLGHRVPKQPNRLVKLRRYKKNDTTPMKEITKDHKVSREHLDE